MLRRQCVRYVVLQWCSPSLCVQYCPVLKNSLGGGGIKSVGGGGIQIGGGGGGGIQSGGGGGGGIQSVGGGGGVFRVWGEGGFRVGGGGGGGGGFRVVAYSTVGYRRTTRLEFHQAQHTNAYTVTQGCKDCNA